MPTNPKLSNILRILNDSLLKKRIRVVRQFLLALFKFDEHILRWLWKDYWSFLGMCLYGFEAGF